MYYHSNIHDVIYMMKTSETFYIINLPCEREYDQFIHYIIIAKIHHREGENSRSRWCVLATINNVFDRARAGVLYALLWCVFMMVEHWIRVVLYRYAVLQV